MKYAILGDIHANLCALEAVLVDAAAQGVQRILSVGDVVGYGAAPSECIQRLQEVDALVVKGNHDAAAVGDLDDRYFNNYARSAVRWTRSRLDEREALWLRSLPMSLDLADCMVAHASLHQPELYNYVQNTVDADPSLDLLHRTVLFVGHTHVPITLLRLREDPSRTGYLLDTEVDLEECARCLVNVGSVGQPRDEDPRTGYALFDVTRQRIQLRRLEYDVEREAARIRAAGLPAMLADRLFLGV